MTNDRWLYPLWLMQVQDHHFNALMERYWFRGYKHAIAAFGKRAEEQIFSPTSDKSVFLWLVLVDHEAWEAATGPTAWADNYTPYEGEINPLPDEDDRNLPDYEDGWATVVATTDFEHLERERMCTPQTLLMHTTEYPTERIVLEGEDNAFMDDLLKWLRSSDIRYIYGGMWLAGTMLGKATAPSLTLFFWKKEDVERIIGMIREMTTVEVHGPTEAGQCGENGEGAGDA
ncbi:hypothetical protein [Azospirillum sp.]|uniref:hypothetical protein n=1 Tax=Azospirillum sp. TaxID=34012 RepID=UPI002D45AA84|nr:hypothetical protein [Azospirillum sp.]HYF86171.1 hypothetical protein [Azospirillum sp.]